MIAQHCEALCSSITNCWRHHELSAAARVIVSGVSLCQRRP
jgi:hypothetical protein